MICCKIWLTFSTINHHTFRLKRRRWRELHLCWETSTAHTNDAHISYFFIYLFWSKCTLLNQCVRTVNTFKPLITLNIYENSRFWITTGINNGIYLRHLSANGRMDGSRNKTTRFRNLLPHFHRITLGHNRFGGCSNVLS